MKPHLPLLLRAALMACFAPLVANAVCIPDLNAPIKVISPAVNGGSYRAGGCGWSYYHRTIPGLSLHGSSEYDRGAAFYACGWDRKSIWYFQGGIAWGYYGTIQEVVPTCGHNPSGDDEHTSIIYDDSLGEVTITGNVSVSNCKAMYGGTVVWARKGIYFEDCSSIDISHIYTGSWGGSANEVCALQTDTLTFNNCAEIEFSYFESGSISSADSIQMRNSSLTIHHNGTGIMRGDDIYVQNSKINAYLNQATCFSCSGMYIYNTNIVFADSKSSFCSTPEEFWMSGGTVSCLYNSSDSTGISYIISADNVDLNDVKYISFERNIDYYTLLNTGTIALENNNKIRFKNNKGFYSFISSNDILVKKATEVVFQHNFIERKGVILCTDGVFQDVEILSFIGNQGGDCIIGGNASYTSLRFLDNTNIQFADNDSGMLLQIGKHKETGLLFENNGNITIKDNTATSKDAILIGEAKNVTIKGNHLVEILDNECSVAIKGKNITLSGNDKVIFKNNKKNNKGYSIVGGGDFFKLDALASSSSIEFYEPFDISANQVELNPEGKGKILLSSSDSAVYFRTGATTIGGGTLEWRNRAILNPSVSSLYSTVSMPFSSKGDASLVFNQSGATDTFKALVMGASCLSFTDNTTLTFNLDTPCALASSSSFISLGTGKKASFVWATGGSKSEITVNAGFENQEDRLILMPLIAVNNNKMEYNGKEYTYSGSIWYTHDENDKIISYTNEEFNKLFAWSRDNLNEPELGLAWYGNTLYYTNGLFDEYWVKRWRTPQETTWRGDEFDYYDINKLKVYFDRNISKLYGDSGLCWFIVGCNIIEYWHDKYAPLYQTDYLMTNRNSASHSSLFFNYYKESSAVADVHASFRDVMYPWFLGKMYRPNVFGISDYKEYSPWDEGFGFAESNFVKKDVGALSSFSKFSEIIKDAFLNSDSAICLSYVIYSPDNKRIGGHGLTVWGAEIDTFEGVCKLYCTDSDSNDKDAKTSMLTMVVELSGDGKLEITPYGKTNKGVICRLQDVFYMTTPSGMDEMLDDFYSGDNQLEWTGRGEAWAAKSDNTVRLANVDDGFKVECTGDGKTVYAHKYFTADERPNFVFADSVGDVKVDNKTVNIRQDLNVGSVIVRGKDYQFVGDGRLMASTLAVDNDGGATISVGVDADSFIVNGVADIVDYSDKTKVSVDSISLGNNGMLWCAGMKLSAATNKKGSTLVKIGDSDYCITQSMLELNSSGIMGNGTLGCYIDFDGAFIALTNFFSINQSDSLNAAFHKMLSQGVTSIGEIADYNYQYAYANYVCQQDATQVNETPLLLNRSKVTFVLPEGEESLGRTVGSHGLDTRAVTADVSVSEIMGGTIDAPDTSLSTETNAQVKFNSDTHIYAESFVLSSGSRVHNDGELLTSPEGSGIYVNKNAVLSGSGLFGQTFVGSGGRLISGESGAGATLAGLTLESGGELVLHADGMGLSGTDSGVAMTLTGDWVLAEDSVVKVAFGLDFLNSCEVGKSLTLNAVQMSESWDAQIPEGLSEVTSLVYASEDGTYSVLSTVGAYIHHFDWCVGTDNTLQLSFILSAVPETYLQWTNATGDGMWNTSSQNWLDEKGREAAFTSGANVLLCEGAVIDLAGELEVGSLVISTPETVELMGDGALIGSGSVNKQGCGILRLGTSNTEFEGTFYLEGGETYVTKEGALGSASVYLDNAGLHLGSLHTDAHLIVSGCSRLSGAENLSHIGMLTDAQLTVTGGFNVSDGVMLATEGAGCFTGDLTLDGGELALGGLLTLQGNLTITPESVTTLDLMGWDVERFGSYEFMSVSGAVEGFRSDALLLTNAAGYTLSYDASSGMIWLHYGPELSWEGGKKVQWQVGSEGWADGAVYEDGKTVLFSKGGSVSIAGAVAPGFITVDIDKSLTIKQTKKQPGGIMGDAALYKYGKATLTFSGANSAWNGEIHLHEGGIKLGHADALGSGNVTVYAGSLNLNNKASRNDIVLSGQASIVNGGKFCGNFTMMENSVFLKGSKLNVAEGCLATLKGGTVMGSFSGAGCVVVDGAVSLQGGTISSYALDVSENGYLNCVKGLKMNDKHSHITLHHGAVLDSSAKISAYELTLKGATLQQRGALRLRGDCLVAGESGDRALVELDGSLNAASLTLDYATFNQTGKKNSVNLKGGVNLDISDVTMEGSFSCKGVFEMTAGTFTLSNTSARSFSLSGKGVTHTVEGATVRLNAKVNVKGNLVLDGSWLEITDASGKNKPQGLTVGGTLSLLNGADVDVNGKVSVDVLSMEGSELTLTSAKAQSLTVKGKGKDNLLESSVVNISGKMQVNGNLTLTNSSVLLYDPSGKNKAMNMTTSGSLTLMDNSSISLSGKLTAKNLTLEGGGITLTSAKLQTIVVKNELNLGGDIKLTLQDGLQIKQGKTYKLITFKNLTGFDSSSDSLYSALGLDEKYCTLELQSKAITLTVTEEQWNAYIYDRENAVEESLPEDAPGTSESVVDARTDDEDSAVADSTSESEELEISAEELLTQMAPSSSELEPMLVKVADTLVQSTWGTAGASLAFSETIAGRGRNATQLGEGKGAAWLSVMGSSSRISSASGHNGADFSLSGAAFGVETCVAEESSFGVVVGSSWGKVNTFSALPVEQDSVHVGIYGNHTLGKSLTLSWMATHTRTESEAHIFGDAYSWSQDALQLDARLAWGKSISDKSAVSAFAALQYLATDSGECAEIKTGSLQNLRVELGVGANHKMSENTMVFGELSFIGDIARNNPSAAIGDYRSRGSNPGRVGLQLSVGMLYQLSEDWSVNSSYSLELMENITSHSLNVGASYSF